jgi:hypothetical protein
LKHKKDSKYSSLGGEKSDLPNSQKRKN